METSEQKETAFGDVIARACRVRAAVKTVMQNSYETFRALLPGERSAAAGGVARRMRSLSDIPIKKKPLLIGIAPAKGQVTAWAAGPSAARLANLLGATIESLPTKADLMNVHAHRDSKEIKVDLHRECRGRDFVIVVGIEAARALGLTAGIFEPIEICRAAVVVIPHTSGKCRWWNSATNRKLAETFFNGVLTGNRRLRS